MLPSDTDTIYLRLQVLGQALSLIARIKELGVDTPAGELAGIRDEILQLVATNA